MISPFSTKFWFFKKFCSKNFWKIEILLKNGKIQNFISTGFCPRKSSNVFFWNFSKILKNEVWISKSVNRFSEKNFLGKTGIPRKWKMGVKIFSPIFNEKCLLVILRPKWGHLDVKWGNCVILKSEFAKSEIRLIPPP